jgi:hypothetical protein
MRPAQPNFVHRRELSDIRRSGSDAILFMSCVAFSACIFVLPRHTFERFPEVVLVWATAALSVVLSIYIFRRHRASGANPWASATVLAALYYVYRYGWAPAVVFYWDQFPWEGAPWLQMRYVQHGVRENLPHLCEMVILGSVAFALGLCLPIGSLVHKLPSIGWSHDERMLQARTILFLPIAVAAGLLSSWLPDSLQMAGSAIATAIYIVVIVSSYGMFRSETAAERSKCFTLVVIASAFTTAAGILSGQIGNIVIAFVLVVLGYMLARARLPWIPAIAVVVLAMFTIFPVLTMYKYASAGARASTSIEERLDYTWASLNMVGYRGAVEMTMERFVGRMAQTFPAIFERFYPTVYPYEQGRTFLLELSTLIPRFAWPEKPSMSLELNRYSAGVGVVREFDGTSAVFDALSEYHVNFGLVGVFVCFVLHGLYINLLSTWFSLNLSTLAAGIMNFAVFLGNPEFFGVGQMFVSQVKVLPVWLLILFFLSRSNRRVPARAFAY